MASYTKEWLSEEEINKLFHSPDISSRDLLLIRLCYYGALRVDEALKSDRGDFKYEDHYSFLVLRQQKTDKVNWEKQPIPLFIYSEVKRFSEDNKIKTQDRLFQSRQSKRLSYNRAYQIVKECAEKAGIGKEISTHTFRRSRATHLLDADNDIFFVKEFLRHKSIDTTRKYLKLSKKKLFEQMKNIDQKTIQKMVG